MADPLRDDIELHEGDRIVHDHNHQDDMEPRRGDNSGYLLGALLLLVGIVLFIVYGLPFLNTGVLPQ